MVAEQLRRESRVSSVSIILLLTLVTVGCASHHQEEVSFRNGDTVLPGTLYIPSGRNKHPLVVFIDGSGQQNRNHLRWYAEFFSHNGIAALIYDKRNVGSNPWTELASSDDLAGDVLAAVRMLKGRGDIDTERIGLWGGSQGSGIAALVAAQSKDISLLISVSGGATNYEELASYQFTNRLRTQRYSEAEIRDAILAFKQLCEYVRTRRNPEAEQAALDRAWQSRWASAVLPSRTLPTEGEMETWQQWREINHTSVRDWERVTIPVLAFWGERDEIVPVGLSTERIRDALNRAGNKDFSIRIISGADHSLIQQPNQDGVPAKEYLDTMLEWTLKQVRVSR